MAALLVLRMVRPDAYDRICAAPSDSFVAAEGGGIRGTPACARTARRVALAASRWRTAGNDFAAALLNIGAATYPFDRSETEDLTDDEDIEGFDARWRSELTPDTPETQRNVSSTLARIQKLRNDPPRRAA